MIDTEGDFGFGKGKQLNRSKEKLWSGMEECRKKSRCERARGQRRTTAGLLTCVARRSGVAGAVAGAAETVPRLPATAAVLAVVGHTPVRGGGVNDSANLWGDTCTYAVIKQRS